MWLNNLKELKKATGMSTKQLAERTNLPERSICRILNGETEHPRIDTLLLLIKALNGNTSDIFAESNVVVSTETVVELQEVVEEVTAEKNLVVTDYELLLDKYNNLEKELERTKTELVYTKKLLAVHEYYTKLKSE